MLNPRPRPRAGLLADPQAPVAVQRHPGQAEPVGPAHRAEDPAVAGPAGLQRWRWHVPRA